MRWLPTLWLIGAAGCIATPVPEPPNLDAMSIDGTGTGGVFLEGEAGAVAPDAVLWVTDLDGVDPPLRVQAAADGSFSTFLTIAVGDELRLQVRDGLERSTPVDVTTPDLSSPPRPLADCLTLEPPLEHDFGEIRVGEEGSLELMAQNDCAGVVRWASAQLRVAGAPFVVESPADLAPGETGRIRVRFAPAEGGSFESVLLLRIDGPATERRPITLFGRGLAP